MKKKKDKKKILFISSTGGHLSEMMKLSPMFEKYDYYIKTSTSKRHLHLKDTHHGHVSVLITGSQTIFLGSILLIIYTR